MIDLLAWAAEFYVPRSLDSRPRKVRFTAETLPAPMECRADHVRGELGWRRPSGEAICIDGGFLTTDREGYRALGLLLLSYALSEQKEPLRIHLAASPEGKDALHQIVLWPGSESRVERLLGFRLGVREVHYRPRLLEGNPNYSTVEQDDEEYPREHLPFCSVGQPGHGRGYPQERPDLPLCLHFAGTSASLVWLGKFLLDASLDDSNCRRCYLYNANPSESLAPGSAELHLVFTDPPPTPPANTADAADAASDAD